MENSNSGMSGIATPLAITGAAAFGIWQLFKYLDKNRSSKATDDANKKALDYTISTQKTKQRIAQIEQGKGAWRKGINGYKKNVEVNIVNEAKDAVRAMYNVVELSSGVTKYYRKPSKEIKGGEFVSSVFSIPLNSLNAFSKVYTIYTGKNIMDDAAKLDSTNYAKIKTLFKVSRDKFPDTWKK